MVVIQADEYNVSGLETVLVAAVTSNTRLAMIPGNVLLTPELSGLPTESVVNVTSLITLNKSELTDCVGDLHDLSIDALNLGLRRVMNL